METVTYIKSSSLYYNGHYPLLNKYFNISQLLWQSFTEYNVCISLYCVIYLLAPRCALHSGKDKGLIFQSYPADGSLGFLRCYLTQCDLLKDSKQCHKSHSLHPYNLLRFLFLSRQRPACYNKRPHFKRSFLYLHCSLNSGTSVPILQIL